MSLSDKDKKRREKFKTMQLSTPVGEANIIDSLINYEINIPKPEEWIKCLKPPDFGSFPGTYCLWNQGEIVYIGEGSNIYRRRDAHRKNESKIFEKCTCLPVEGYDRKVIEQILISIYKPKYNDTTSERNS